MPRQRQKDRGRQGAAKRRATQMGAASCLGSLVQNKDSKAGRVEVLSLLQMGSSPLATHQS